MCEICGQTGNAHTTGIGAVLAVFPIVAYALRRVWLSVRGLPAAVRSLFRRS